MVLIFTLLSMIFGICCFVVQPPMILLNNNNQNDEVFVKENYNELTVDRGSYTTYSTDLVSYNFFIGFQNKIYNWMQSNSAEFSKWYIDSYDSPSNRLSLSLYDSNSTFNYSFNYHSSVNRAGGFLKSLELAKVCDSSRNLQVYTFMLFDINDNYVFEWQYLYFKVQYPYLNVSINNSHSPDYTFMYIAFNYQVSFTSLKDLVIYSDIDATAIREEAYNNGYVNGYGEGYYLGLDIGQSSGYDEGYNVGLNNGYQTGYNAGYNEGANQDDTASAIFVGITEVGLLPVNVFLQMFNYEVFGINISGLISALITVSITIIIFRFLLGKKDD